MNVDIKGRLNTLIKKGCLHEAFYVLDALLRGNALVDPSSYIQLLQGSFLNKRSFHQARVIHSHLVENVLSIPISVCTTLVDMYAKFGHIHDARCVFDHITHHNVVSWTAMIAGYVHDVDHICEGFILFQKMLLDGVILPNSFTFLNVTNACTKLGDIQAGRMIHASVIEYGLDVNPYSVNALINMYMKCDSIEDAIQMFESICYRDVITWTIIITGYAQKGHVEKAFRAVAQMECEGFHPDDTTFICMISACTSSCTLGWGRRLHAISIHLGYSKSEAADNALIDMYHKCGKIDDACQLFQKMHVKNVVTWNTMISGYAKHGLLRYAFKLYEIMDCFPNRVTFVTILKCCATVMDLEWGKSIYNEMVWNEVAIDVSLGNSLIDFYVNCNKVEDAQQVFINLRCKDVVSWTMMIRSYGKNEYVDKANKLLREMELGGVQPNEVTFVAIINACSLVGNLELSMQIHSKLVSSGKEIVSLVANALIDSYVKCGDIHCACFLFDKMTHKDIISWNSIISGYALHGYARKSVLLVERMQQAYIEPNDVTFLGVLSACSRVGLIDEAVYIFISMVQDGHIILTDDHFVCMVDLLARIGHLYDAAELIRSLPLDINSVVSRALLNGCKLHGEFELAISVIENMIDSEQDDASAFALMLNMFASCTSFGVEEVMSFFEHE